MIRFTLRELEVVLEADEPERAELLSHLVNHAEDRFEPRASVRFRFTRTASGGRQVFEDDEAVASKRVCCDDLALSHIHHRLNTRLLALYDEVTCLHCAAATIDGRLALFTGDRGAGKTTLLLGLLKDGAAFHCDEMLLVRDGEVLTLPRRMHVKAGTLGCVPGVADACIDKPLLRVGTTPSFYPIDPVELGHTWQSASGRPAAIFHLRPAFDAPPAVDPMSQIEMVKQFMCQTLNGHRDLRRQARDICGIVNGVPCFSLRVGDLPDTSRLVRRTMMSVESN